VLRPLAADLTLSPCTDATVDAAAGLMPVSPAVLSAPVLARTAPATVTTVGVRALTPSASRFASSLASVWSLFRLLELGVLPPWVDPASMTADGSATGHLSAAKLDDAARSDRVTSAARARYDALKASPAEWPGATPTPSSALGSGPAQPLLVASGPALANATAQHLVWALRLPSGGASRGIPRELLLAFAGRNAAFEVVVGAANAAGRTGTGSVAAVIGALSSAQLDVTAAAASDVVTRPEAVTVSARASASICGAPGSAPLSGPVAWSLRLASLTPLNTSWALRQPDTSAVAAAVAARSATRSPSRWAIPAGLLPAGFTATLEVTARATLAGPDLAVLGSVNVTVTVAAAAGVSLGVTSSSGLELSSSSGTTVRAAASDLDGTGRAVILVTRCFLVPGGDAAALAATAASASSASASAEDRARTTLGVVAALGSTVPCTAPAAWRQGVTSSPVSLSTPTTASSGGADDVLRLSPGGLRPGAILVLVEATAGSPGARPPLHPSSAASALLLQLRPVPAIPMTLSVSAAAASGTGQVVVPAHRPAAVTLTIGGRAGSVAALGGSLEGVSLRWDVLDASGRPLRPALSTGCAVAAGPLLWTLLPSSLLAAVDPSSSAPGWAPAFPHAMLLAAQAASASAPAATASSWAISGAAATEQVRGNAGGATVTSFVSARSLAACSLADGATATVRVTASRASDGAAGSVTLRLAPARAPLGGDVAVSSAPGARQPANGSLSVGAAVTAMAPGAVSFASGGWAGASSVSFSVLVPSARLADRLAASPQSASAVIDVLLSAPRTSTGALAPPPASSGLVTVPLGAGSSSVVLVVASAQSEQGGVALAWRSSGDAPPLLLQSLSPLPPAPSVDTSDMGLTANVTAVDATASVSLASELAANGTADALGAIALGDTSGAVAGISGLAALLSGAAGAASPTSCHREMVLGRSQGPHASCSGAGECVLSQDERASGAAGRDCATVLAAAQSSAASAANSTNRTSLVASLAASLSRLGCAAACRCDGGRSGQSCAFGEAAAASQRSAKASMLSTLGAAAALTDPADTDAIAATASAVGAVVAGDPSSVGTDAGNAAASVLESLTSSATTGGDAGSDVPSMGIDIAAQICAAASGLVGVGAGRSRQVRAQASSVTASAGRRLASAAELQASAAAAKDAADVAFRARAVLGPAALMGFVRAGASYSDGRVAMGATGSEDGTGTLSAPLDDAVAEALASSGSSLVTTRWGADSPYAAAAVAETLARRAAAAASEPGNTTAASLGGAASTASAGDVDTSSVTEVTALGPPGAAGAVLAAANVSASCLTRSGGVNGSTAASYGVKAPAGAASVAGLGQAGVASPSVAVTSVRCLASPLQLTLPLPAGATAATYTPRWWSPELGAWSTAGVVVLSVDAAARTVTVATTHLTAFSSTADEVFAQARLPPAVGAGGILRNYLRPENAVPAVVIVGMVLLFGAAWLVAWRYDRADRVRVRHDATRRALVLAYGFTDVPTHELVARRARLDEVRREEEVSLRRKYHSERMRAEAGSSVVPVATAAAAAGPSPRSKERHLIVAADALEQASRAAGAGRVSGGDAPPASRHGGGSARRQPASSGTRTAASRRSGSTDGSSPVSQYASWVCRLFAAKLRADHPLSFCTAPAEALVLFSRTQRVLVLCVLWLLAMAVAATFFGSQPQNLEIRGGVLVLSALCMLPATFLLPFLFKRIASVRSSTAAPGTRAPRLKQWRQLVRDRAGTPKARKAPSAVVPVAQGGAAGAAAADGAGPGAPPEPAAASAPEAMVESAIADASKVTDAGSGSDSDGDAPAAGLGMGRRRSSRRLSVPGNASAATPAKGSAARATELASRSSRSSDGGRGAAAAGAVAEAARKARDTVLLTSQHAEVIVEFSPFFRGPHGVCHTSVDIAAYFTLWCGLALVAASVVFAVTAEGLSGASAVQTSLTPTSIFLLGLGVALVGSVSVCSARAGRNRAKRAARHGHAVFLADAARRATPLSADAALAVADIAVGGTVGGTAARRDEGVITVRSLERAAARAVRAANQQAGYCGCLGGGYLVLASATLATVYVGQAVAAALFVTVLDAPLAFEGFATIVGLEAVLIVMVAAVLLFVRWDANRSARVSADRHRARRVLAKQLQAQAEAEIARRQSARGRLGGRGAGTGASGPTALLPRPEVDSLLAALAGSALPSNARPSRRATPAVRRFQAAAVTVLAHARGRRHDDDVGRLHVAVSEAVLERRTKAAVLVQAMWRGHTARRSALRLYELRVWDEDLAVRRSALVAVVYLAALLLLGVATYMCLVFGILFTPEQGRAWILTSLASFALDLLVQKPIIIFVNSCALVAWGACTGRTHGWTNVSPNFVSPSGSWLGLL